MAVAMLALFGCSGNGAATDGPSADGAPVDVVGDIRASDLAPDGDGGGRDAPSGDAAAGSCISNRAAGHHQFVCDGLKYDVDVSPACAQPGASCGLVLDVHGFTMSAQMQDANSNMRAFGAQHGYIVVQPNAPGLLASWDAAAHDAKIHAFVTRAITHYGVDSKRVHMTGFSQGGYMSWRFICKFTDTFASVAPAAACGSAAVQTSCAFGGSDVPSRAIPILYMHGTKDALVKFDGCAPVQRDAVIAHYKLTEDKKIASDATHIWTRYVGSNGEVFEFLQHEYVSNTALIAGHCFPGSKDPGGAPLQLFPFKCDSANQAFNWGEVAMKFFIDNPRK